MVGGAVRNALLGVPIGDIDIATTALPQEVMRRAAAAGFKPVPTGIEHGTVTVVIDGRPFEVTTLREDVETFGRHAKVRFGRDWRRDAERRDFTMNALSVSRRRHGARLCRRARRSRSAARALHRRRRQRASPRTICASCASSASTLPTARARPTPPGLHAVHRRARRPRAAVARARAHGADEAPARAARGRRRSRSMAESGLLGPVLGGVPRSRGASPTWSRSRPRSAARRTRCAGSARSACWIVEDAERLWQRLRLSNAEHERLAAMARLVARSRLGRRSCACAALSARVREHFTDACCSPGRARRRPRTTRSGARSRPCRSAGPRRCFRSRPPISSRAACRRDRHSAQRLLGRGSLDRRGFPGRCRGDLGHRGCRGCRGSADVEVTISASDSGLRSPPNPESRQSTCIPRSRRPCR